MKLIITWALLAFSQAQVVKPGCDLKEFSVDNYEKEVLKEYLNDPYQMAIDYNTNTIFFSHSSPNPKTEDEVFQQSYLNLKTNEHGIITGIRGGFAAAVDNNNHKVYLGGRNGLYEYDYETKKAIHINPDGYSIWQLFYKDVLYYTAYPQERAFTFEDGKSEMVPELEYSTQLVALDNNNNMYFSNSSGLYVLKTSKNIEYLGEYNINSFTADKNGNLYFSTPSGLYSIDDSQNVTKLVKLEGVLGLVVDENRNFIYAMSDRLIRLRPTKNECM